MAKRVKEALNWVSIAVPKQLEKEHETIRGLFAQLKTAKEAFETKYDKLLIAAAANLPADVQETLRIVDGKFPANTVRKFSYMRGVAVATASKPKSAQGAAGGLSLS